MHVQIINLWEDYHHQCKGAEQLLCIGAHLNGPEHSIKFFSSVVNWVTIQNFFSKRCVSFGQPTRTHM